MYQIGSIAFAAAIAGLLSGCVDDADPREDDDVSDAGDTDSEDSDSDASASGIRGYTFVTGAKFGGVHVSASDLGSGAGAGSANSGDNGYYEIELPPGVYSITAMYASADYDCDGGLIPVVISAELWVDLDLDLYCSDLDP